MTQRDVILHALREGMVLCDDCLSLRTSIQPRQTVNAICRDLERGGSVRRQQDQCPRCGTMKIVNASSGAAPRQAPRPPAPSQNQQSERPWYWEGHVQDRIVQYLQSQSHEILSTADTASREAGKDVVARAPTGESLWISVKGYPERSPQPQARHWFSLAIFDLVMYRDEDLRVQLALGLPAGFTTYENLSRRVSWLRRELPFGIYWVSEAGTVTHEP